MFFKVDFVKAYDSVRWDFFDGVLNKFGFGNKWRTWIQSFLRSSRGSILINGSPTEEFQFFKGLKQACAGLFTGIILSSSLNLSHLFYTDDAMFVGQWCDANIDTLVHILECFYQVSGMRINMSKSRILGVPVEESKVKNAAGKLGCLILKTLFLYLGTKVGGSMSRVLAWKVVVDKKSSLWTRVIKAIHGDDGSVGKNKLGSVRSCWMNVVHESKELENLRVNIFDYIRLKVGNGESTLFWEEKWIDGLVLKDIKRRCEAVSIRCISELINIVPLVPMADRCVWSLESSGEFSVASLRKVIDGERFPGGISGTRWVKLVPIKVNVLAWKIKTDAIPTRFNISRRGITIDSLPCPICDCGVESTSHLFFECSLVRQLARKVSRWWNVGYSDVNSYDEWLKWIVSLRLTGKTKLMIEGVFMLCGGQFGHIVISCFSKINLLRRG
uniref:RNA-directed DNA polymerase, eukaryota n=1 Tax=Tanacetum cinerariifolium TaxID=118510 RepID=A0A6L2J6I4_TANCI|nr:RNA-directed DNA polymerase, eukaryota [Tanacetum cinerariifolium]